MPRFEKKTNALDQKLQDRSDTIGNFLVDAFHHAALFAIGGTIVWSAIMAFLDMAFAGGASIHDILLLFIYLELGAMVGIYFKTDHMPVRFLIYVAITALVRMLLDDVHQTSNAGMDIIYISGAILMLAVANLVVRYSSFRFPNPAPRSESQAE